MKSEICRFHFFLSLPHSLSALLNLAKILKTFLDLHQSKNPILSIFTSHPATL